MQAFDPEQFLEILQNLSPTWYAASPAVHEAIIQYAEKRKSARLRHSLCRIQTGGAPLPEKLATRLEDYFNVVVVQGYGLTETAAMGTCNPPIPELIKKTSVGVPVGCEIKIMDGRFQLMPSCREGQIFIKGPGVMAGYENDDEANKLSYIDEWFATGDQGYLDDDGYLFITGRIKELINCGGQKISPYETEEAIRRHPDVADAAVFAIPHETLGEVPAAMVVLKTTATLKQGEIQLFLRNQIAQYKIPVRIKFTDRIPKGRTGKVDRSRLHLYMEDFSRDSQIDFFNTTDTFVAPRDETEKCLADIWEKHLKLKRVSVKDNYFDLGGDSLGFVSMVLEIQQVARRTLPFSEFIGKWTIEDLAGVLNNKREEQKRFRYLIPMKTTGNRPPLFCIHDVKGSAFTFRSFANHVEPDQPVYALWLNPKTIHSKHPLKVPDLARRYLEEIKQIQGSGPYYIAGHSMGGLIGLEISLQLRDESEKVASLMMIDTWLPLMRKSRKGWPKVVHQYRTSYDKLSALSFRQFLPDILMKIKREILRIRHQIIEKCREDETADRMIFPPGVKKYSVRHLTITIRHTMMEPLYILSQKATFVDIRNSPLRNGVNMQNAFM